MLAPLCKFCGSRHYGLDHSFKVEKNLDNSPIIKPVEPIIPPFKGNVRKLKDPNNIMSPLPDARTGSKAFKNGKSYSKNTTLYTHNCHWCGKEFKGGLDKTYCSDNCRLVAWRNFKRKEREPFNYTGKNGTPPTINNTHTPGPISWGKKRFFILQRDQFKCKYCGRSANDGYILHVDHIHPKSKGGTDDIENLVTACKECNQGKLDGILDYNPFSK